jgi:uncharacterized membrane protein
MQRNLEHMERLIGKLLIVGVAISGLVAFAGGVFYLIRHGDAPVNYQIFRGEPADLSTIAGVAHQVGQFTGRGLIQLGLILLVALQVLRVALTAWLFHTARDWKFTLISLMILSALAYNLFSKG